MATRIVYFLADEIPNDIELAELEYLNRKLQVTVMNASENVEFGETDRILPCDYVAGTIPPEYAHIPVYDPESTPGGPIYITDVVGLPAALDAKADKPVGIEDVTGLQTELDDINTELDAAATLPIAIADVTGLQSALNSKATKPVPISDVSGLQTELDSKAELPIAISDVTGLQEELDAVALLPINISDVTGLQTELDSKATLTQLETVVDALDAKADAPIQIQDVEGLETELDSVATLPIAISDVTGLQDALDSAGSLPIEISDVTGLQAALDAPVLISEVTGLQTALDSKAALTDLDPIIADLATKQDAPVAISDVTGLQAELDSVATLPIEISDVTGLQAELDSVATLPIAISDVTGLQTALDAPTLISEVTGLQTALDGKADVTDLDPIIADLATKADAPVLITDVTGLQTELDGKAELPIAISDVTGLQAELDSSATLPIAIADVTGLQTELDGKAELPVTIADVTGLQAELDNKAEVTDLTAIIAELDNKLESPIAIADVTGLQANLDSLQTEIDAAATLPIAISDVTGLQTALDAPIAISDVTGLEAALAEPVGISDVTGLQAELDSKADLADLDPIITDLNTKLSSPIAISDVTNLQTTLDGKAPVSHAHTIANVTGLQAALDSKAASPVPISNVTGLQASLDGKAAAVHGHAIADVSGLQTALDGKSATTHVHPVATTLVDGFFSKTDKAKLDGVATGATNVTFPVANAAGTLASGAPQAEQAGAATPAARSDHQHPLASAINDGLMSAANWTKLDSIGGAQATVHVYVAATGSDANVGSQASPKATIAGAWALLPATQTATFVVHLAAGTYTWTEPPDIAQLGFAAMIIVQGDTSTTVASGMVYTVDSMNGMLNVDTVMTAGQYVGHTFQLANGYKRLITSNTTTQMRISDEHPGDFIMGGTAFTISKCDAGINLLDCIYSNLKIHFVNMFFLSTTMRNVFYQYDKQDTRVFFGVSFKNKAVFALTGTTCAGYCPAKTSGPANLKDLCAYVASTAGASDPHNSYQGWGISNTEDLTIGGVTIQLGYDDAIAFFGTAVMRSGINLSEDSSGLVSKASNIQCMFVFLSCTYLYLGAFANVSAAIANFDNPSTSARSVITTNTFAKLYLIDIYTFRQLNTANGLISISDNSEVIIRNNVFATVTSAGSGITVGGNGQLHIPSGMSYTCSNGAALIMKENAKAMVGYFALSQTTGFVNIIRDNAKLLANTLNLNYILYIQDNASVCIDATGNLTVNAGVTSACCNVFNGGRLVCKGTCNIVNSSSSGSTLAGLACSGGGHAHFQQNPTITATSGAGAFGVNCRGGGKFTCAVQPTGVVGTVADFTIGPLVGDQYADTLLATAYAHATLGPSSIQRTA